MLPWNNHKVAVGLGVLGVAFCLLLAVLYYYDSNPRGMSEDPNSGAPPIEKRAFGNVPLSLQQDKKDQ